MAGTRKKTEKEIKVTVDGIEVTVLGEALTDMRTVYLMGKIADDTLDDGEKIRWYMLLLDTIFAEPTFEVMERMAEARDGHLDADEFSEFFAKVLEEVGAKN